MTTSNFDFVTLIHGPTLPVSVIVLALKLEHDGWLLGRQDNKFTLTPKDRNKSVAERSSVSEDDRILITNRRDHLLALVDYMKTTTCCEGESVTKSVAPIS